MSITTNNNGMKEVLYNMFLNERLTEVAGRKAVLDNPAALQLCKKLIELQTKKYDSTGKTFEVERNKLKYSFEKNPTTESTEADKLLFELLNLEEFKNPLISIINLKLLINIKDFVDKLNCIFISHSDDINIGIEFVSYQVRYFYEKNFALCPDEIKEEFISRKNKPVGEDFPYFIKNNIKNNGYIAINTIKLDSLYQLLNNGM